MTDIQTARYDRVFDAYQDADGFLTRESWIAHTRTLAEVGAHAHDSPKITALVQELNTLWDMLANAADTDHDGRVSRDEWRAFALGMTATLAQVAEEGGPWLMEPWIRLLYDVIDLDGDGHITKDEYTAWLESLGLAADTDIDAVFALFDTNEHGYLSWEEFAALSQQYWLDFDENVPGHRWIGP